MGHPIYPRIDGSELILVAAESLVYGVFLVLFYRCFCVLLERRKRPNSNNFVLLIATAIFLFVTITAHLILDISRAYDAFIYAQDEAERNGTAGNTPNPATLFFADIATPKYLALAALYQATTTVGDAFMVYRLWIVWDRSVWVVVFPILLEIAMNVTASRITVLFSRAHETIFKTAGGWITAFFVLTFFANILSTVMISYKVWRSNRTFGRGGGSNMVKIFHVLVQSAALYSFFLIITLATYVAQSNVQFIMVAVNNPIIGIIFAMIIVRGGSGSTQHSSAAGIPSGTRGRGDASYAMHPMAIKISTDVEVATVPASFERDNKVSGDSKLSPYSNNPDSIV